MPVRGVSTRVTYAESELDVPWMKEGFECVVGVAGDGDRRVEEDGGKHSLHVAPISIAWCIPLDILSATQKSAELDLQR